MIVDPQWSELAAAVFGTAAAVGILRLSLLSSMRAINDKSEHDVLRPSELAYLFRPGDSAHCLSVLIVDLLQKGLKSPALLAEELTEAHYETEVWNVVRAYITGWTIQKAQTLLPELVTKSPVKIAAGFWRLRHWLTNSFKGLLNDLIKDPLSLRRYFSPAGLMRVLISLLASGIKEPFMRNLRAVLLKNNLLLSDARRKQFANYFGTLAAIFLVVVIAEPVCCFSIKGWPVFISLTLFAAFDGVVLKVLSSLPSFVPFYEQVSLVLDSVGRRGFRVTLLRNLLRFLRTVFWSAISFVGAIVLALQTLILVYLLQADHNNFVLAFLSLTGLALNFFIAADLCTLALQIQNEDQVSAAGEKLLRQYQSELKGVSPITAFSAVLADPQYNEQLSNIVSIYGIETLFLLA